LLPTLIRHPCPPPPHSVACPRPAAAAMASDLRTTAAPFAPASPPPAPTAAAAAAAAAARSLYPSPNPPLLSTLSPENLASAARQGLILVHFSAQLEPCLTQENTLHTLNTP